MALVSTKLSCPFCGAKAYDYATDKCALCDAGGAIADTKNNGANYKGNTYILKQIDSPIANIVDPNNANKFLATINIVFNTTIASLVTTNQSVVFMAQKETSMNGTGICFISHDGNVPANYKGTASHALSIATGTTTFALTIPNLQKNIVDTHWLKYRLRVYLWDNTVTDGNLTKIGLDGFIPNEIIELL